MVIGSGFGQGNARTHRASVWSLRGVSALDATCVVLGVAFCLLRFLWLESNPRGFFSDEFRGALHQICLAENGRDADGNAWPAFVQGAGGGLYTPVFLYLGLVWIKIFGPTIAACRALAATATLITIVMTALVARRLAGQRAMLLTFVAASLSPWSFQFARIAWDPPLAPAFVMSAIYLWLSRARLACLVGSALCFAGALYCYPPARLHAPLVFLLLGGWALWRRTLRLRDAALFALVVVVAAFPLLRGTLDGSLMQRTDDEAIWNATFVKDGRGRYPAPRFLAHVVGDHLHSYFRPTFLFFTGDTNFRHSTQLYGQLGLLDDVVLAALVLRVVRSLARAALGVVQGSLWGGALTVARARLLGFAAAGYLLGVLPAALCWSGTPHALRAIGAWPFLALFTGTLLAVALQAFRRWFEYCVVFLAVLHAGLFAWVYFVKYPRVVKEWFDVSVQQAMLEPGSTRKQKLEVAKDYPEGFRYYAIAYQGATCDSSKTSLKNMLARRDR
jgi:4-amino-4-deoxy-L-arabinose transferase-like glycosyltransferase